MAERVILASGSRARAALLRDAGVAFETRVAGVDEAAVRESLGAEGASTSEVAVALAELKAIGVSRQHPDAFVIGADQMLECNGVWFEKPADRDQARGHLQALSGREHTLVSAVLVARAGSRLWHATDTVRMRMRQLSAGYIDSYLDAMGDDVCSSVGAYRLEGLGAQLFDRVEGDFFTVLGLPLLPLLGFLRTHRILET